MSQLKGQIWFLTGSQNLYGPETLEQVADQSKLVMSQLAAQLGAPAELVDHGHGRAQC